MTRDHPFTIRSWAKGSDEGALIGKEARKREITRPAFVSIVDAYSQSVSEGFMDEFGLEKIVKI